MQNKKLFSILTIVCFCSFIFIPIGIALMCFFTDWKKKLKVILGTSLGVLYVILVIFLLNFNPSGSGGDGGMNSPFGSGSSVSSVESSYDFDFEGKGETSGTNAKNSSSKKNSSRSSSQTNQVTQPSKDKASKKTNGSSEASGQGEEKNSRIFISILFVLIMGALILWQNLRKKKDPAYENPYVDTSKYKLPLEDNAKMPLTHCQRLRLNPGEVMYYATDTNQPDNPGVFVITNQRVVMMNLKETTEFTLDMLEAAASTTNTVMNITVDDKKYYIFMPENQMKYALGVLRWTVKTQCSVPDADTPSKKGNPENTVENENENKNTQENSL